MGQRHPAIAAEDEHVKMRSQNVLEIRDLRVSFVTEQGANLAVDGVSFALRRGSTLGIVGESGSGKSTTALAVMRLLPFGRGRIESGEIWLTAEDDAEGRDLVRLPEKEMQAVRATRVAMVFQEPMTSLNPVFRCGEQIVEAMMEHFKMTHQEARARTVALFNEVRLPTPEAFLARYPHQLSGGQKQRVMIAMALSCDPDVLIADEPTSALDVTVQKSILELLNDLQKRRGMSILFISHDLGVIAEVADEVAVMYRGRVVESGRVWDIFASPSHPYTKGLLACRPPVTRRLSYLPTIADFMEEKRDARGEWIVTERSDLSVEEMIRRSSESSEEYRRRLQSLRQKKPILTVCNLKTYFPTGWTWFGRAAGWTKAVDGVTFDIYPGETLGLVGESGCGKTTLARTVLRLTAPQDGEIRFMGADLLHLSGRELRRLRRHIQIVFQDPYSSLNPRMPIGAMLTEPMKAHGLHGSDRQRLDRAVEILETVGLEAGHLRRYPHEFSGGQRQRISIARALTVDPTLIICDEAVSALDVSIQAQILNLLNELQRKMELTYIFISHDLAVVKFMSDRIIVMKDGKIEESAPAEELYASPKTAYTQELISATPAGTLEAIRAQQRARGRM
jgi:peptide/nickel transport system ATP-binding protein